MAVACAVVGVLLYGMTRHGEKVEVARAHGLLFQACERIHARYVQAAENTPIEQRPALESAILQLVLADYSGTEGGIWESGRGVTAYAYPTYQGSGVKNDVPPAELANITQVAQKALQGHGPALYTRASDREVLLLAACPLQSAQSAWVMSRVHTESEAFYRLLKLGLAILFGVVLLSLVAVAWVLRRWDQKIGRIEHDLVVADPSVPQPLAPSGSDELDRLSQAINRYAQRSVDARREARELAAALARGERLADIGRMVATVAHEIRNPIATMRLTAENAVAASAPDAQAMERVLQQIDRLDDVVESLLTMAQPIKLHLAEVELASWAQTVVGAMTPGEPTIDVVLDISAHATWRFDPLYMERALTNLLRNAREHARAHTLVRLRVASSAAHLTLVVSNTGLPVPDELSHRLFEPFASGRLHGNGLGLALVREIALSHGGQVDYRHAEGITEFSVVLPWL